MLDSKDRNAHKDNRDNRDNRDGKLPSPIRGANLHALRSLAKVLQQEPLVAVDTESNSLFAYHEQVCLIQLSTPTQDWVVDPLAISDMSALGPPFASPHIEKVFHPT